MKLRLRKKVQGLNLLRLNGTTYDCTYPHSNDQLLIGDLSPGITAPKEAETEPVQESTTAIDSDDEDEDAAHFAAKYKSSSTPVGAGCFGILIDLLGDSSYVHFVLSSRLLDPI